jgi:hypothetical protein
MPTSPRRAQQIKRSSSSVVGCGEWPTNSLLCPYSNASRQPQLGADPLFHISIDRSILYTMAATWLGREKAKDSCASFFFFMSRVRAPDGYLTPLISCLSEKICCIVYNNLGRTNAQFWIGLLCLVDHFYFIFHSCFEIKISLTG